MERVATPATYELVSEQIRRAIHIGAYLPGDKLPAERQLADQMGVSRTTIREALRVLEGEGYVESHRGATGGIVVLDQSASEERIRPEVVARLAEFEELFDFRMAVEGAAARLAAVRRTEADLSRLQEALDAMEKGRQTARFRSADSAFHLGIADAAHNRFMRQAIETRAPGCGSRSTATSMRCSGPRTVITGRSSRPFGAGIPMPQRRRWWRS